MNPNLCYAYPKLFEVLKGDAHNLLQRTQNNHSVDEVNLVTATREL
ncbi:MAG: hypothetical protein WCI87_05560 [Euryarchaeota archaeon]